MKVHIGDSLISLIINIGVFQNRMSYETLSLNCVPDHCLSTGCLAILAGLQEEQKLR